MIDSMLLQRSKCRKTSGRPTAFRRFLDASRKNSLFPLFCCGGAFLFLGSAVLSLYFSFFLAPVRSSFVCLPVNMEPIPMEQLPQGATTRFPLPTPSSPTGYGNFFSEEGGSRISKEIRMDGPGEHARFAGPGRNRAGRGLVHFSQGRVSIPTVNGAVPVTGLRHSPIPYMRAAPDMFQADMFVPALAGAAGPPLLYGEETDDEGRPKRWNRPAAALPSRDILACGPRGGKMADTRRLLRRISVPFTGTNFGALAIRYKSFINLYADKYDLAASLMLAIMHTESNFNPFAVSRKQAVGLMQIVPDTAGNEVYKYITGFSGSPSVDTLFSPEHNIRYGAVYLHLLERRYFGRVRNPASRQMCIVAAYNGGPGAVLRLFDSYPDAAVDRINALAPEAVYAALTTEMPKEETRRYVEVVLDRMRNYAVE